MDSQASLLWAQVMHLAPTLRCPTHRDPTLRALTSMDLDSKALPATLWVSYDVRVASYTKKLQQSLAIRVDRNEHKPSAAFPLRKFLVNTGGRNFTETSHLALLMVMSPLWGRTPRRRHEFPSTCSCHMTVLTMTLSWRATNRKKIRMATRKEVNMEGAEALKYSKRIWFPTPCSYGVLPTWHFFPLIYRCKLYLSTFLCWLKLSKFPQSSCSWNASVVLLLPFVQEILAALVTMETCLRITMITTSSPTLVLKTKASGKPLSEKYVVCLAAHWCKMCHKCNICIKLVIWWLSR